MGTVDENEVCRAVRFAREMHAGQCRKGTDAPYVTHLENVGRLLADAGCDTDTVVAGILHDVVEDTPATFEDIQQRFGAQVMELVAAASERDKSLSWKRRKELYLRTLESAPPGQLFIPCADKLDNIRFLNIMLLERGRAYFSNFNAPERDLAWFYLSAAEILATRLRHSIVAGMAAELVEQTKRAFTSREWESGEQRMSEKKQEAHPITIKAVTRFTPDELFGRLRKLSMLKDKQAFPYADAEFALVPLKQEDCWPAQRYVLSAELEKVQRLEWELARFDVDIFKLDGFVRMLVEDAEGEREIDLLPPVVEEWDIPGAGRLNVLNDGMHRTYLSYQEWKNPQVVLIKNIPAQYPYYAYPLIDQWKHIDIIPDSEVPKGYVKKWHRIADNKLLYRDFNSSFLGVGSPRGKKAE